MNRALLLIAALALAPASVLAQGNPGQTPGTREPPPPVPPRVRLEQMTPPEVVDAFHYALRAGDKKRALELMAPDLLVFEQGRLERSRAEYARRHLDEDIAFASVTRRSVTRRSTKVQRDVAWVLSVNKSKGIINNKAVELTTNETMVLRRLQNRWQIVHIHWSFTDRPAP